MFLFRNDRDSLCVCGSFQNNSLIHSCLSLIMRKRYPLECKLKAVEMYNEGITIASIAQQLNVSARTVCTWKSIYHKGSLAGRHLKPKNRTDIEYKKLFIAFNDLKREMKEIKLECEILKMGSSFLFLKPREKYLFIQQNRALFSITKMCKLLKIGSAGYHRWLNRPPSKQSEYHKILMEEVKGICGAQGEVWQSKDYSRAKACWF